MARTFKMIADTNNGVQEVDSFEGYEGIEIVDEDTFLDMIETPTNEEFFIGAELSEQMYLKLIMLNYYFKK